MASLCFANMPFWYNTCWIALVKRGHHGTCPIFNFWQCHSANSFAPVTMQSIASNLQHCAQVRWVPWIAWCKAWTLMKIFSSQSWLSSAVLYLLIILGSLHFNLHAWGTCKGWLSIVHILSAGKSNHNPLWLLRIPLPKAGYPLLLPLQDVVKHKFHQ